MAAKQEFLCEFRMFFHAKTDHFFEMQQSNLPLDLKKCLQPPNNQPKCFLSARQRKEKRRKRK